MNILWITVSYVNIQEKSSPRDIHLTWIFYIIEPPYRNIGAWHDSNTLQTHLRINIKVRYIKYTNEYISKLQLRQYGYHFKRHSKVTITSTWI